MKKVIGILTLVLVFSLTANAQRQNQGPRKGMKADYTPEQVAELQTKKMTLYLDLTKAQQDKVFVLLKENAIERKAMRAEMQKNRANNEKPDSNKRFELENARLDRQIAHRAEMKKILDKEQFEKWEKFQEMKNGKKEGRKNGRKEGRKSRKN